MEKLTVNYIRPSDCIYLEIICKEKEQFYNCGNEDAKQEYGRPNCRSCNIYKGIDEYNKEMEHKRELEKLKENLIELRNIICCESNNCNLTICRYNQSGTCTNEEKRKECVGVSKRALCLKGRKNEFEN